MPWQALHRPSLPIGILHALVARDCPDVDVVEFHGGLRWAEYVYDRWPEPEAVAQLSKVAEDGVFHGLGELVFASELRDDPAWRLDELADAARRADVDVDAVRFMRSCAEDYVGAAAEALLAVDPDLVGLTTTFMQNLPSLALARRLKQLRPSVRVVLGGANCEGPMGHAVHRNHPYVDYVVRGEAEEVFPLLLRRIRSGESVVELPGVCWWDGSRSVANPVARHSVPPAVLCAPDYDGWQEVLEASPLREFLSPELVLESARGCWWGEKHHCTFCGLNGAMMAFRSKPAATFWAELSSLVERHQILDVSVVDNILDMGYFSSLLPLMTEADWDLRVHYEVKSNLRATQIADLAAAGIVVVQPGIESLNARVLDLMDKGVTGAANVQTLRECEDHSLTVEWNYLYGFPGELASDYRGVLDQLPALVHLQPPGGASRIVLERFSPYFERPELGFARREPMGFYQQAYDLPRAELDDLAYFFGCDDAGIDDQLAGELAATISQWRRLYPSSSLTARTDGGADLVIEDRRAGWAASEHRLGGWQAAAYRSLDRRASPEGLRRRLERDGVGVSVDVLVDWLRALLVDGLVFVDGADWVALAVADTPWKAFAHGGHTREPAEVTG